MALAPQVPQDPPHPSLPHCLPSQFGVLALAHIVAIFVFWGWQ